MDTIRENQEKMNSIKANSDSDKIEFPEEMNMASVILKTKLFVPPPRENAVIRSQLLNKLNIYTGHKLTLVSAPAGYGKTTLLGEWLKNIELSYAWLSLDNLDNDISRFFMYFITALQRIDGSIGKLVEGILSTTQAPSCETVVNFLINDMAYLEKDYIIILDDYHVVSNNQIHKAIQHMLEHQPPRMHLVILSRELPQLSLSRIRARGQLIEIEVKDLCFSQKEAEEFFHRTMQLNVDSEEVKILKERTEGWITGLQLAGLSIQGKDKESLSRFIREFSGSSQYIMDYLIEEILDELDSNICVFLYHTSILNRFTASLCDELMNREDSKSIIEYLSNTNLFIIPLDDRGEWYRYHHSFAEFLKAGLGKYEEKVLRLRAAKWLEHNNFLLDAVEYVLEAGEMDIAEKLIEKAFGRTFLSAEFSTFIEWTDILSSERLLANPTICAYRTLCYFVMGKIEEALSCILASENSGALEERSLAAGRLMALKSAIYMIKGKGEALQMAEDAVSIIRDEDPLFQIEALHALGHSYKLIGDMNKAVKALKESMIIAKQNKYHTLYIAAVFYTSICLNRQGKLREAEKLCVEVYEKYKETNEKMIPLIIINVPLGILYYENDCLDKAKEYLDEGVKVCSQLNLLHIMGEGIWLLPLLQYSLGDVQGALRTIKEARQAVLSSNAIKETAFLDAVEAELYMREGNLKPAIKWIKKTGLFPQIEIKPYLEPQYLTYARVLIAQNMTKEAEILLSRLEQSALNGNRFGSIITIYILKAKVYRLQNRSSEALKYLEMAINNAATEGYYRCFIEEGQYIEDMLPSIYDTAPYFVEKLQKKFQSDNFKKKTLKLQCSTGIYNPLSEREMEVLRLISSGFTNDEIAEKLFITIGTTKNHISNIYSKLGVKKRNHALVKAKELGIL